MAKDKQENKESQDENKAAGQSIFEAIFGKQPADLHEALLDAANEENQAKLMGCAKEEVMRAQIERKRLVREMERLDMQISVIDAKVQELCDRIESGDIVESDEVHAFIRGAVLVSFSDTQPATAKVLRRHRL